MQSGKILFDLFESISEARAHWQAWWAMENQAKPSLVGRMNRFPDFFNAATRAHFNSLFINLAHAFDKRRDVSSIERYLTAAKDKYSKAEVAAIRKRIASHEATIAGVLEIRNGTIAHKSVGLNEKQVFAKAKIRPRQIQALVEEVTTLVNEFTKKEGWDQTIFTSERVSIATLEVIKCIPK